MSLEGWKPLDFSAFNLPSMPSVSQADQTRQYAKYILANTQFTPLDEIASDIQKQQEGAPHSVGVVSRILNLLSTPKYAVTNALDESLAGHEQKGISGLENLGATVGGLFTGAARGIGAGLASTFGPDSVASDPTDKPSYGDVLERRGSNREMYGNPEAYIDDMLRKYPGTTRDGWLSDIADAKKSDHEKGLVLDILADPLNLVTFGAKKGAEEAVSVGNDALKASDIAEPGAVGAVSKGAPKFDFGLSDTMLPTNAASKTDNIDGLLRDISTSKPKSGSYRVILSPGSVQNTLARGPETLPVPSPEALRVAAPTPVASETEDFNSLLNSMADSGELSSASRITETPRPTPSLPPKEQLAIERPELQAKVAGRLARNIVSSVTSKSSKGWQYQAIDLLTKAHPEVEFARTAGYLERLAKNPNAVKTLASKDPKRFVDNLKAAISDDVKSAVAARASKTIPAEKLVDEVANGNPVADALVGDATERNAKEVLKPAHQQIANNIAARYTGQVLHNKAPVGINNPERYVEAIKSGRNVAYSGPKQANMLNSIIKALPQFKRASDAKRYEYAAKILNQIEDAFIAKGAIPQSGVATAKSVPLRLSEVMFAVGPQQLARDPRLMTEILKAFDPKNSKSLSDVVQQAVEQVKAKNAIAEAPAVAQGVNAGQNVITSAGDALSAARLGEVTTIADKTAQTIARNAGASEVGSSVAGQQIKDLLTPKNPVDAAIVGSKTNTLAVMSNQTFKNYAKYSNAPSITRAISQQAGLTTPRKLAEKVQGLVPEWLGARFNAAYKNLDMRPIYLQHAATAKSTVARRAHFVNELVRNYGNDPQIWADAVKGAQGHIVPSGEAAQLSKEYLRIMENLFGSSGLRKGAAIDSTVAGRSQLLMKELNDNLRRYGMGNFKFTNSGTSKGIYGTTHDYSKGIEWLNSWENWSIANPIDFLYRVQNVVETTVREKVMFDDIAARWGNIGRSGHYSTSVSHPRFSGYFFSKDHASQINTMLKHMNELKQPSSKGMQMFDNVLSKWKTSVTIYMPSHYIRNLIGDTYFNWVAGVNSVRPYTKAINVMRSQAGKYEGLDDIGALTSPDALASAIKRGSTPGSNAGSKTAFTMKNGDAVTNDMVYVSAYQQGLLPSARVLEDIPDDAANFMDKIGLPGKARGKAKEFVHTRSEERDHFIRLAHYIDGLMKHSGSFAKATEDSARAVRKWHPDGMDLTKFERNVMRRAMPFYSWTRKSIPLIVESILSNPGKTMAYPKAVNIIQQLTGMDVNQNIADPFPVDQLFPDWIRDKGIGPIMGAAGDYTIVNPSNPFLDLGAEANHPIGFAAGMSNPIFQIPAEVATGVNVENQVPITDWSKYATDQIPGASTASRLTNLDVGGTSPKYDQQGFGNSQNLINFLTAAGVLNTGPYQKSAQFDLKNYLRGQSGR